MSELPGSGSPTTPALIEWLEHEAELNSRRAQPTVSRGYAANYEDDAQMLRAAADALRSLHAALEKINTIRSSIVGLQALNWSEHVYPLVAALDEAGYVGMSYPEAQPYFGTMLERTLAAEAEVARLTQARDTLRDAVKGAAVWIRTPGNISHDDAIDDCARVLENLLRRAGAEAGPLPSPKEGQ